MYLTCALDGYVFKVLAVVGGVDGQLGAGEEVGLVPTALHIVQQNGQGGGAILSWIHCGSKPWKDVHVVYTPMRYVA